MKGSTEKQSNLTMVTEPDVVNQRAEHKEIESNISA